MTTLTPCFDLPALLETIAGVRDKQPATALRTVWKHIVRGGLQLLGRPATHGGYGLSLAEEQALIGRIARDGDPGFALALAVHAAVQAVAGRHINPHCGWWDSLGTAPLGAAIQPVSELIVSGERIGGRFGGVVNGELCRYFIAALPERSESVLVHRVGAAGFQRLPDSSGLPATAGTCDLRIESTERHIFPSESILAVVADLQPRTAPVHNTVLQHAIDRLCTAHPG